MSIVKTQNQAFPDIINRGVSTNCPFHANKKEAAGLPPLVVHILCYLTFVGFGKSLPGFFFGSVVGSSSSKGLAPRNGLKSSSP